MKKCFCYFFLSKISSSHENLYVSKILTILNDLRHTITNLGNPYQYSPMVDEAIIRDYSTRELIQDTFAKKILNKLYCHHLFCCKRATSQRPPSRK